MIDEIALRFPFWGTAALIAVGLYGMILKRSLVKKLIGLNIFQSAIILFFVAGSVQDGATLPILFEGAEHAADDVRYINPLPHVLMLTAIVVGIATTGVALAFLTAMHREFGSTDEEEILEQVQS
jgi:multicomponent Na+:H+ antiporter subunit C